MTTSRRLRPLAIVALLVAGCANGSSESTTTTTATVRDKGVEFSECMRKNGVSAFPDPNASGELTIDAVANGTPVDPSTPAFEKALSACKDLQPSGFTGRPRSADEQDGALRFAECMRENGVEDFPDPAKGEPLVDTRRIPSSAGPDGMNNLHAAMDRCRDAAADAMGSGR